MVSWWVLLVHSAIKETTPCLKLVWTWDTRPMIAWNISRFGVWKEGCIHLSFLEWVGRCSKVCQWYFGRLIMSGCLCVFLSVAWGVWCRLFSSFLLSHFIHVWVLFCLLVNNSLFESVSGMVYRWSSYASFTPHVTARVKPGFVVKVAIIKKIIYSQIWLYITTKQNPSMLLATYWNLSSKSGWFRIIFFEIWRIWVIFPHEKILCIGWNHIFQVKIWWKLASKTNAGWSSTHTGTLTCFEWGLFVTISSPKNVRFGLRDPDLV